MSLETPRKSPATAPQLPTMDEDNASYNNNSFENEFTDTPRAKLFQDDITTTLSDLSFTSTPQLRQGKIRKSRPSPATFASPPIEQGKTTRPRRENNATVCPTSSNNTTVVSSLLPIRTAADASLVEQQNKSPSNPSVSGPSPLIPNNETTNEMLLNILGNVNENEMETTKATLVKYLLNTATVKNDRVSEIITLMMTVETATTKTKVLRDAGEYLCKNYPTSDGTIQTTHGKLLIPIKKPRKLKHTAKQRSKKIWLKEKKEQINGIVNQVLGTGIEFKKDIIDDLIDDEESKGKITALGMTAVRDSAGFKVPISTVDRIARDITILLQKHKLLKDNSSSPFEGSLRKKMGMIERIGAVPNKIEHVECRTTKEESSRVVYWYIENVPLLMERLLACSIKDKTFQTSLDVSSYIDKILFKFGCDRGSGDLIMMISLMNRLKGNHGKHALAIGVAEGAQETYANLKKTVYSNDRKEILEQLVNRHLYMIQLTFIKANGINASTIGAVKCIIMQLKGIDRDVLSKTKFVVQTEEYSPIGNESIEWNSNANNRSIADTVIVNNDMCIDNNNQNEIHLKIQLIKLENNYVGCKVLSSKTKQVVFSFKFDTDVAIDGIDSTRTISKCSQCIGFPSEDGKMCTSVSGLSTCSASYPCPNCLWHHREETLPSWMQEFLSEEEMAEIENSKDYDLDNVFKEYDSRINDKSKGRSYHDFSLDRGGRTDAITIEEKRDALSVIYEPLLNIDDEFIYVNHGGPLHISQGLMTHLTQMICEILGRIEINDTGEFTEQVVTNIEKHLKEIESMKTSKAYKKSKTFWNQMTEEVKEAEAKFEKARDDEEDENTIQELYAEWILLAEERNEEGMLGGQYLRFQRIVGAEIELKKELAKFKKSTKKSLNKAVFLFMKSLKVMAGDFNKSHGVHELTNARGITALADRKTIYDLVVEGFNDNAEVKAAMDWWLQCAEYLNEISLIMKSQKKLKLDGITRLKQLAAKYVVLWYTKTKEIYSTRNPIFWKLHMLLCGIIPFAERTHFIGLVSEEGFENKHHVMRKIRELMAPIACDTLRCEKMNQRQQTIFIPGLDEESEVIEEAKEKAKRKKRGLYKNHGKNTKLLQNIPLRKDDIQEPIENYFVSSMGNFIPENLRDEYVYLVHGKVPEDWAETFHDNMKLGSKAANEAGYVPP